MNGSTLLLHDMLDRGDYLERLSQKQARMLLGVLEKAHDEVIGKIAKTNGELTRQWLAQVATDIDAAYKVAADQANKAMQPELEGLAADESAWIADEFNKAFAGVSTTSPATSLLWASIKALPAAAGSTLDQLFAGLAENSRAAAIEAIQLGMVEGETVDQLTRRLRGRTVRRASWRAVDGVRTYIPGTYEGGALENVTTRQAKALARTAVMHVGNQAREAFYQANDDIIKGYQRVETLDGDTCLICGADDGHVYKADEPRPVLPFHVKCRGLYIPVLKSFRELGFDVDEFPEGTRASMDGQVAESVTYADRLAKMSDAGRTALLGPGRAALYNRGIPIADMVREGKLIPLQEMNAQRKKGAA